MGKHSRGALRLGRAASAAVCQVAGGSSIEVLEHRTMLSASAAFDAKFLNAHKHDEASIIVKFKDAAAEQTVLSGTTIGEKLGLKKGLRAVELRVGVSVEAALAAYQGSPLVEYAEPNYVLSNEAVSNDPYFKQGSLWGMSGPTTTPTSAYGSNAAAAWASSEFANPTGSPDVYVGIIDEGIHWDHPDLVNNAWTNPFDKAGDRIDNDGNGYVDDVHGWDFNANDNTIYDGTFDDHGTHVAGTIAGQGGNGVGVAGVNWRVKFISGKFLGRLNGTTADAIRALDYMTDLKLRHGLNIVATSNSWGGDAYSQGLQDAISRAAKANILFIAAAGNGGSDNVGDNNDSVAYYPSGYDTTAAAGYDSVISVAAISGSGGLASFSNFGAKTVDLAAPGVGIYSTLPGGKYGSKDGTSMAAPHVTGAAALYAANHPGATAATIRAAILDAAKLTPTSAIAGKVATGGRLDVLKTLRQTPIPAAPQSLAAVALSSTEVRLNWADVSANETSFAVERADWDATAGTYGAFASVGSAAANAMTYNDKGLLPEATYAYRVRAVNGNGASAYTATVTVTTKAVSTTPPNAPVGLTVAATAASAMRLTWTDNAGDETGYRVERSTTADFSAGVVAIDLPADATEFNDSGLGASTVYYYRVVAFNEVGASAAATGSDRTLGTGDGLTGKYYDYSSSTPTTPPTDATAFNAANLKLTRVDPQINFGWGSGSPAGNITTDTFAVRWTGKIETRFDEPYTFTMEADDGVRLYVDGQPVIDSWKLQWVILSGTTTVSLAPGLHDIRLDYYDGTQGAVAKLYWESPSQAKELVPRSQLYSTAPGVTVTASAASSRTTGRVLPPAVDGTLFATTPVTAQQFGFVADDETTLFDEVIA